MSMRIKLSIIMPVYNAGAYFAGAVESVLDQSYSDFELILVDDGATDGSGQACDKFAAADQRVRVIHVPNGGICKSRNIGILHFIWIRSACVHSDIHMVIY